MMVVDKGMATADSAGWGIVADVCCPLWHLQLQCLLSMKSAKLLLNEAHTNHPNLPSSVTGCSSDSPDSCLVGEMLCGAPRIRK